MYFRKDMCNANSLDNMVIWWMFKHHFKKKIYSWSRHNPCHYFKQPLLENNMKLSMKLLYIYFNNIYYNNLNNLLTTQISLIIFITMIYIFQQLLNACMKRGNFAFAFIMLCLSDSKVGCCYLQVFCSIVSCNP